MRLIYKDKYDIIDRHISDSQIGGRKGKNVRNHVWIVNGIICDVLSTRKKTPVDILIYDYKQCFDSLWLQESLNDIYESGFTDDNLAVLYDINSKVNVAVKTPVGRTGYGWIHNVITQGDVFSPILCSNQIDEIGKECLQQEKYTYSYKGEVDIPPLGMVDNLITVSDCGHKTAMVSSYINGKTDCKKLQFGVNKCKKIHVGKTDDYKCQDTMIDSWNEEVVKDFVTGEISVKDFVGSTHVIESTENERYLGDLISRDGKNILNIKSRVAKGIGIVNKIITMLNNLPIGRRYFEIAMILRDSLLISSMLFNSVAWYNITNTELSLLETVDTQLLRRVLDAPRTTPKEFLYLELGCIPFRDIIRQRRLGFYHYILNESSDSLLQKCLKSQQKNRTKKDWITQIEDDKKFLDFDNWSDEGMKSFNKESFMKIIKNKNKEKSFEALLKVKEIHSKVQNIKYEEMKMQRYLQPNKIIKNKEDAQFIFKLRCQMTNLKANMKGKYETYVCRACKSEDENQKHVYQCKEIDVSLNEQEEYETLLEGTLKQKLKISEIMKKRIEKLQEIEQL